MAKRKPTLLIWGLALMAGGAVAGTMLGRPRGGSLEAQGEAFGQGVAVAVCWLAGIVMIVLHFVRKRKP